MHTRHALLGLVLLLAPLAASQAQSFRIVSSTPSDGAAGVPLDATIVFEFTEGMALSPSTADWNTAVVFPRDQVRIERFELCVGAEPCGGDGKQRFVRYVVEHQPDTDYTWLFYDARNLSSDELAEPYVLRYTTAATIGDQTVSGTIDEETTSDGRVASSILRSVMGELSQRGLGRAAFESPSEPLVKTFEVVPKRDSPSARQRSAARVAGPHTRVLLLDEFALPESDWSIRYATVAQDGAYALDHVRAGTYWPLVVRYTDATAAAIEGLGYYDPDEDGEPDAITVPSANQTDIELSLFTFALSSARTYLDEARALAAETVTSPDLYIVTAGDGSRPEGTAYVWEYVFVSADDQRMVRVLATPLELVANNDQVPGLIEPDMLPVPDGFIDSSRALDAALTNGGDAFLSPYRPSNIRTGIQLGNFRSRTEAHDDRVFWWLQLIAQTSSSFRFETYRVDAVTGDFLGEPTDSEDPIERVSIALASPAPNPVRSVTTLHYHLDRPDTVRLSLYDALGREVAVLADGVETSGDHAVSFDASGLPSGVYLVRFSTEETRVVRRLVVSR